MKMTRLPRRMLTKASLKAVLSMGKKTRQEVLDRADRRTTWADSDNRSPFL